MKPLPTASALLSSLAALILAGCGPTFFSAKGTIASTGGPLETWSNTPAICSRDSFSGDTSKILTLTFANPNANDPDRDVHDKTRPAFPTILNIMKDDAGYKANLDLSKAPSIELSKANCKVLSLDTRERGTGFAESHPSLDGTLTLDCTPNQSHITADISFKHCS